MAQKPSKKLSVVPKIIFTQSEIDNYVSEKPLRTWCYRIDAAAKAAAMSVHANGTFPAELIRERRPHEHDTVYEYREKIWKPVTKAVWSKVFSELQKIRRSSDWAINYDLDSFTKIAEDETLETYCEKKYPYYDSVTNWAFSALLRKMLIDPNAVCVVRPIAEPVADNAYVRPYAQNIDSADIIDFVPDDYLVYEDRAGCTYFNDRGVLVLGRRIVIITTQEFLQYDQINQQGNFKLLEQWAHGLSLNDVGVLPAFGLRGVLVDVQWPHFLYESRLAGMLPYLDEAIREYSDLQAATVLNMFPERWEYVQTECPQCRGAGVIPNPKWYDGCPSSISAQCKCEYRGCIGGYIASGPYSKIQIKPTNSAIDGSAQVPTPPAGFIEKDVEIIRLQRESFRQNIYDALGAVNFEFLAEVPIAQSGIAKEYDSDALNNTVHSIAEDLVASLDRAYLLIALYRYGGLYGDDAIAMTPSIPVPERFDIMSSTRTLDEIGKAEQNNANPVIKSALEIDYASKRFNNNSDVRDMVALCLRLDPLPNISEDEKMSRLSNKGITQLAYVISSNIEELVRTALTDRDDFPTLGVKQQKEIIVSMAQEIIDEINDDAPDTTVDVPNDDDLQQPEDDSQQPSIPEEAEPGAGVILQQQQQSQLQQQQEEIQVV